MVKLNGAVKDVVLKTKTFPFATCSAKGEPNVVPVGAFILQADDETVWIVDNFMNKTIKNLKENPKVSVYAWNHECENSYQIKGDVTIETSGKDFEAARQIMWSMKKELPAKALIKMKITAVYCVRPGPNAGKKVL